MHGLSPYLISVASRKEAKGAFLMRAPDGIFSKGARGLYMGRPSPFSPWLRLSSPARSAPLALLASPLRRCSRESSGHESSLEEEASSFLSSLRSEPRLASSASSIRSAASQLRERALELRTIADRREALQAQLEESLEELEALMAELRWPLLAL